MPCNSCNDKEKVNIGNESGLSGTRDNERGEEQAAEKNEEGGLWSWFKSKKNSTSNMEKGCDCNKNLREHLKECCDYGNHKNVPEKCERNEKKEPKESSIKLPQKKAESKESNFDKPTTSTASVKGDKELQGCNSIFKKLAKNKDFNREKSEAEAEAAAKKKKEKEEECNFKPKNKPCPPIPCCDTSKCVPNWMCEQSEGFFYNYPSPTGVEIQPIPFGKNCCPNKKKRGDVSFKGLNPSCPMLKTMSCENPTAKLESTKNQEGGGGIGEIVKKIEKVSSSADGLFSKFFGFFKGKKSGGEEKKKDSESEGPKDD